jgi:hypothetical protein
MKRVFILFAAFIVLGQAVFAQDKKDEGGAQFWPKRHWFRAGRVSTFGEFIAGGSRIADNLGIHIDGFALAAGGGMDLRIKQWFSWRAFQSDYSFFRITGENSNGVRIGTGIVFRFGPN